MWRARLPGRSCFGVGRAVRCASTPVRSGSARPARARTRALPEPRRTPARSSPFPDLGANRDRELGRLATAHHVLVRDLLDHECWSWQRWSRSRSRRRRRTGFAVFTIRADEGRACRGWSVDRDRSRVGLGALPTVDRRRVASRDGRLTNRHRRRHRIGERRRGPVGVGHD